MTNTTINPTISVKDSKELARMYDLDTLIKRMYGAYNLGIASGWTKKDIDSFKHSISLIISFNQGCSLNDVPFILILDQLDKDCSNISIDSSEEDKADFTVKAVVTISTLFSSDESDENNEKILECVSKVAETLTTLEGFTHKEAMLFILHLAERHFFKVGDDDTIKNFLRCYKLIEMVEDDK